MDGDGHTVANDKQQEQEKVNFIVGCEDGHEDSLQGVESDVTEEATDLFPTEAKPPTRENSTSSNLNAMFALAEKRKRLR
jgi:hypothetical protein